MYNKKPLKEMTREEYNEYCREMYARRMKDPEFRKKKTSRSGRYSKHHPEKAINCRRKLKADVIEHYGSKCACWGESTSEFLTIDHISGGGTRHLEELGRSGGHSLYLWLRKNNYPEGFRTLCLNWNFAYGHFGYCPHQVQSKELTEKEVEFIKKEFREINSDKKGMKKDIENTYRKFFRFASL